MSRLDQERQANLEPKRIQSCKEKLESMGFAVHQVHTALVFEFQGCVVQFWPYSGWHTGKTIQDGRGFDKLIKQLEYNK